MIEKLEAPPYLSPSSIATFQQCPLKYKFSRIDGLIEPPTEATLRGNFVHSVLEHFYALPSSQRTLLTAKDIAKDIWDKEYLERVSMYVKTEEGLRAFRWSSWWCVENLFLMENPQEIDLDGIETEINGEIGGVKIKGFIDRWYRDTDSQIIIGDYKTGKAPSPRYREDKYFQLFLYAYALEQQLGEIVKEIELLFIKDSVRLNKPVTDQDRMMVKNTVVSVRNQIDQRCESGLFEPIKHKLCDWCTYKPICPAWSKNDE